MRVKWETQYKAKGPRDLEALIYKNGDDQWHWEVWSEDEYDVLAKGQSYDPCEAKIQVTNAMTNIIHWENSELQQAY